MRTYDERIANIRAKAKATKKAHRAIAASLVTLSVFAVLICSVVFWPELLFASSKEPTMGPALQQPSPNETPSDTLPPWFTRPTQQEPTMPAPTVSDPVDTYYIYQSLVVDTANGGYGVAMEAKFWTGAYFKKENMSDQSCSVLGEIYSGSYQKSIIDKLNSYTTDIYADENYITFGFRSDTNQLVSVNLMNLDFFESQPFLPEVNNPYESAISFATEIASTYVDDIADYTQIIGEPTTQYKEKDGVTYEITYYYITFAKKINDYFSSDYISIKVTSKGTLASIVMGDINAFDGVMLDFDPTAVNKSIAEKVDASYKDNGLEVTQWNITDQKIVVTPNGYICMYSTVEVEGKGISDAEVNTGICIMTVLGRK